MLIWVCISFIKKSKDSDFVYEIIIYSTLGGKLLSNETTLNWIKWGLSYFFFHSPFFNTKYLKNLSFFSSDSHSNQLSNFKRSNRLFFHVPFLSFSNPFNTVLFTLFVIQFTYNKCYKTIKKDTLREMEKKTEKSGKRNHKHAIMMDDDADLFFKWVALFGLSSLSFSFSK